MGGESDCDHVAGMARQDTDRETPGGKGGSSRGGTVQYRDVCGKCGAVRTDRQLGMERTVEEYVERMVDVFKEVRRVLHSTGLLCVIIGDGYNNRSCIRPSSHQPSLNGVIDDTWRSDARRGRARMSTFENGLKEKDLYGVPFLLALALRTDGWYWRSLLPWVKYQSCMPESTKDRPTSAVEYVLLCSKQAKYHWDHIAIQRVMQPDPAARYAYAFGGTKNKALKAEQGHGTVLIGDREPTNGRSYRNADAFLDTLDAAILAARADLARLEAARANGGLLTDDEGEALALLVNPQPFTARSLGIHSTDHYASYPARLIEPLIKAGCPEKVCSACKAPWERVVERTRVRNWKECPKDGGRRKQGLQSDLSGLHGQYHDIRTGTLGWAATCSCDAEPTAGTVLDPFLGTGTTLEVAAKLNRHGIGIELSPEYAEIARLRIGNAAPLFNETVIETPPPSGPRQAALLGVEA